MPLVIARLGGGGMLGKDAAGLDEKVVEEPNGTEHEGKSNRAGRQIGVELLELPDEEHLDCERGQWNQDGGHVQSDLPVHEMTSLAEFRLSIRDTRPAARALHAQKRPLHSFPPMFLSPRRDRFRGARGDCEIWQSPEPIARPWCPEVLRSSCGPSGPALDAIAPARLASRPSPAY